MADCHVAASFVELKVLRNMGLSPRMQPGGLSTHRQIVVEKARSKFATAMENARNAQSLPPVGSPNFTEHSDISASNACWPEQQSTTLRMSDAKYRIIYR
jgi:hypothetical protein